MMIVYLSRLNSVASGKDLHGGNPSISNFPLLSPFFSCFSEIKPCLTKTSVATTLWAVDTNWLVSLIYQMRPACAPAGPTSNVSSCGTKLDHLQCILAFNGRSGLILVAMLNEYTTSLNGGWVCNGNFGLREEPRYLHLDLLFALDHPLPGGHLADVHQGAIRQQGTQLSDKIQRVIGLLILMLKVL